MQKENILLTKHRKSFRDSIKSVTDIPDLLSVQKESFNLLVQAAVNPDKRENIGLQKVFKASFPIEDYQGRASLSYVSYRVEEPKYSISECKLKGYNYQSAIYVKFDLCTWEYDLDENENPILETKRVKDIKQQEVFFGEIPIMTPNGAFIINGTERVIVNQLHRSPGVFFDAQRTAKDLTTTGKTSFTARIVPQDGRWLDFEFDSKDILFVRIDRKKKFHSTLLMLALGQDIKTILNNFYKKETIKFNGKDFEKDINFDLLPFQRASHDVMDSKGNLIVRENRRFNERIVEKIKNDKLTSLHVPDDELLGSYLVKKFDGTFDKENPIESSLIEEITDETIEYLSLIHI